ncbi:MAG: AmmeMemoRadiSam system radical SAM enzyme [Bacteroidales bacterium]|nr:AmmeMemoRadiSam system radical SAM enzyme [Lentimicrobiaceae bacterium]MDD5695054.1 AmmeMemoRadiSam system radical SAM enzyme [Bacteroidales bacterium]
MHEALYYEKRTDGVMCTLCPHFCHIRPDRTGICRSRFHRDRILVSGNYGKVSALHFDPIEKKPLYHFYPGRIIFSIGSTGCNLQCSFCQNAGISQVSPPEYTTSQEYTPGQLLNMAFQHHDNMGVAFTYNEPAVWYEYMFDIALLSHQAGLKNIMVTNGFINPAPLQQLMTVMDAFSVDLKAFTEEFYRKITRASLEPVKETLKCIRLAGKHLEITNLVIPTLNDDEAVFETMCRWIADELGAGTILHLSRYFPTYKMTIPGTAAQTLINLRHIAMKYLDYVFIGNITLQEGNDTVCARCGTTVISRRGYVTSISGLDPSGNCAKCGNPIAIV